MRLSYRLLRAFLTAFFRVFTRYEVVGRENVPKGGPLIVATNHIHTLDSPAVMAAIPLQITTFAARKWEHHWKGTVLRWAGVIFVSRGEVDRQALRRALEVLNSGGVLGMAPEGTRSKTYQLQSGRGGIAYLAHAAQPMILPVATTGVEHVLPALRRGQRARVRVTIGQPFRLPMLDHRPRPDELLQQADIVMRHIAALLPHEYRGVYADGAAPSQRTAAPRDSRP
ncbi:MAG: lysophospholipid acyltransferase family protein [Anaerolineae bacterium]